MSHSRTTGLSVLVGLLAAALLSPASASATSAPATSGAKSATAATAAAPRLTTRTHRPARALRLSAPSRVTAGSRVAFRVRDAKKVPRTVRLQRWDARSRSWRTVAKRKVRGAARLTTRASTGTWKYRAVAAKARKRSGGTVRVLPAARSTVISVVARATAAPRPAIPRPRRDSGAQTVGSAHYPVPAGARYVRPGGSASGSGTLADPYGSLAHAVSRVPAGTTLVLRAGRYHEDVLVPRSKTGLVIQNYPGEAVWLDGSEPVTAWQRDGTAWVASDWEHTFDHRIMSGSTDETSRWVDASRPLASHPDQVWLDGRPLTQVGSQQAVKPGAFFVDVPGRRLVIGDDPTGRSVEASSLQRAMEIHAENATVRGVGIRRYATTQKQFAALVAGVPGITLENVVVSDNAWVGIAGWADRLRLRNVTASGNGIMGFGGNNTNDLVVEDSEFRGNNAQGFKPAPVASGLKITRANKVVLRNNVVANTPYAGGVWFDVSSSGLTITGNTIFGNAAGLMIELSEGALVADNHIYGNAGTGVRIQGSGSVDLWNNTIVGNPRPFAVWADARRQNVPALAASIPWRVAKINVRNNVMSMTGSNPCPILTQDESQRLSGNDFGITSNNNVFHRPGAATPANFACWANGIRQVTSFKDLTQFRAGTGNDKTSRLLQGSPVADGHGALSAQGRAAAREVAAPLPSRVAAAIGQATGATAIGAITARN